MGVSRLVACCQELVGAWTRLTAPRRFTAGTWVDGIPNWGDAILKLPASCSREGVEVQAPVPGETDECSRGLPGIGQSGRPLR